MAFPQLVEFPSDTRSEESSIKLDFSHQRLKNAEVNSVLTLHVSPTEIPIAKLTKVPMCVERSSVKGGESLV